jgi:hypothetical protein
VKALPTSDDRTTKAKVSNRNVTSNSPGLQGKEVNNKLRS